MEQLNITNVNFEDPLLYDLFKAKWSKHYKEVQMVLEILALCHTVIAFQKDGKPTYNSTSPDELALVNAAKFFGINFRGRDENSHILLESEGKIT